jgi:16S rRNA (guanine527-N7)-methyltransferase
MMDEAAARRWLSENFDVPRETFACIEEFVALLTEENHRQNLVSAATLGHIWSRHIVDSAQLLSLSEDGGSWADLGTGAGFPGLIVGLLRRGPTILVEQRRLRVEFLRRVVERLGLVGKIEVAASNVSGFEGGPYATISARAFAPLDRLFALSAHLAAPGTKWILPKGRNAKSELEAARASWQGVFCLEPSVTDPDACIVIAEQVRRKPKGKRTP